MQTLRRGDAEVVIDHEHGGRLASLVVAGHQLLVTDRARGPMGWGCFPMIPWAGRIRRGRFTTGEWEVSLPLGLPPHAIHGTTYDRPWAPTGQGTLSCALGSVWPWAGTAHQRISLGHGSLSMQIRVEATDLARGPMPVSAGWHPWFRRRVGGADAELSLPARSKWRRDAEGIPDGTLVAPGEGPWDDCFTDLDETVDLTWPGVLRVRIASDCPHVVVYDEPADSICIEPQSAPPDAHNSGTDLVLVTPEEPFVRTTTWTWDFSTNRSS